jgi:hypothetical protein
MVSSPARSTSRSRDGRVGLPHDIPGTGRSHRAPLELAGRKLLALFGRAEARDFADAYVLAQRFGKDALLEQAQSLDAGFDRDVLAQMMGTLGRFADDEIPLAASELPAAKAFFTAWAKELR